MLHPGVSFYKKKIDKFVATSELSLFDTCTVCSIEAWPMPAIAQEAKECALIVLSENAKSTHARFAVLFALDSFPVFVFPFLLLIHFVCVLLSVSVFAFAFAFFANAE